MRQVLALGSLAIVISGCMPMGELGAATSGILSMVPDPSYIPREGDRVYLYGIANGSPVEQLPILSDLTAFDKYERCVQADDSIELAGLEEQKWLQFAPIGTQVFIVRLRDRNHTGARVGAEVRILDGPHKGRVVWTPLANLARLKKPEPTD